VDQALIWLERLPGVGRKVAAATLNFSTLRRAALVIDTHHLRVLRRLGLIDRRAGTVEAYDRLVPLLPGGWTAADLDEHHQLMKALGQTNCRHAFPICRRCPLRDLCPTAAAGPGRSRRADALSAIEGESSNSASKRSLPSGAEQTTRHGGRHWSLAHREKPLPER
jgi:adenine-specific DNA glycosylase